MSRKMKKINGEIIVNVKEHILLKNFWEYYIIDDNSKGDIKYALVMGHEIELGDVSYSEIKPYIISVTENLYEVLPATGWIWVE